MAVDIPTEITIVAGLVVVTRMVIVARMVIVDHGVDLGVRDDLKNSEAASSTLHVPS